MCTKFEVWKITSKKCKKKTWVFRERFDV